MSQVFSFYDLFLDANFKKAWMKEDKETIEKLLYMVGVDTTKEYKVIDRLHRPLSFKNKEPVKGPMLEYQQRVDKQWLSSPYATWDEKLEACEDVTLKDQLGYISFEYTPTTQMNLEIEKAAKEAKKKVKE